MASHPEGEMTGPVSLYDLAVALVEADAGDRARLAALAQEIARAASTAEGEVAAELTAAAAALSAGCAGETELEQAQLAAGSRLERAMKAADPEAEPEGSRRSSRERSLAAPAVPAASRCELLPPDADTDLLAAYTEEALEYLAAAEASLLALEADPEDHEALATVFRAFHTLKGTSAFLGLEWTSRLAHCAESLLIPVRDKEAPLTDHAADLALRAMDALKALVTSVPRLIAEQRAPIPADYDALTAELLRVADDPFAGAVTPTAIAQVEVEAAAVPASAARAEKATKPVADRTASASSWVRVRTDRLDGLMNSIGELVIAQSVVAQDPEVNGRGELRNKIAHAGKIVRELQDLSIAMRMVPLRSTFQRMTRLVRDLSHRSGKAVELVVSGENTEVDRNMVEVLGDPLVHLIRNAVDHGIEPAAERLAARKPAAGRLRLSAYHAGGEVALELADDGGGLDRGRILAKAVACGLVERDRQLSESEVHDLIFAPGFSTADAVSEISGRGVGLDVVRRAVESLRGRIEVVSAPGAGTTFSLRVPLTLAITDGMIVRVGEERFILPTAGIQLSFRPERDALYTVQGRGEVVRLRDDVLPIVRLHRLLGCPGAVEDCAAGLLVVVGQGERRCALLVDQLQAQHQVVAKSLGAALGKVAGVSGAAILGDGRVGLILDVQELVELARRGEPSQATLPGGADGVTPAAGPDDVARGAADVQGKPAGRRRRRRLKAGDGAAEA